MKPFLVIIFILLTNSILIGNSFYKSSELNRNDTIFLFVEDFENKLIIGVSYNKSFYEADFFNFLDKCNRLCIRMELITRSQKIKVLKIYGYQEKKEKPIRWRKKVLAVNLINEARYTRIMNHGPRNYPIIVCLRVKNGILSYPTI